MIDATATAAALGLNADKDDEERCTTTKGKLIIDN